MATDFDRWLAAQFAETGPFTIFIVLVRIGDDDVVPLKSSYAHMIGSDFSWRDMRGLLDGAGAAWDGAAFFVGLDHAGGPLADEVAARKLKQVEADVHADAVAFNRGLLVDREGRQLSVEEVTP
jgi:hypothetical protein